MLKSGKPINLFDDWAQSDMIYAITKISLQRNLKSPGFRMLSKELLLSNAIITFIVVIINHHHHQLYNCYIFITTLTWHSSGSVRCQDLYERKISLIVSLYMLTGIVCVLIIN